MNWLENLKNTFKQGSTLIKLIYLNVGVFLVLKIIVILLMLFKVESGWIITNLAVPADLNMLLHHCWTLITYMFLHERILHILFNMLCLFWFGRIFLFYFSEKQLVGLYVFGGLSGALFYVAFYNIFPYFAPFVSHSLLLGASGSIMAIIVASAVKTPNMEIALLIIGRIKLKFVAIAVVGISFISILGENAGGEIAHLGGAFAGYIYAVCIQKGRDITKWINRIIDFFVNLFKPRKLKVSTTKPKAGYSNKRMSGEEYNMSKANDMVETDRILDKIKDKGYASLTEQEKKHLFGYSNKNKADKN